MVVAHITWNRYYYYALLVLCFAVPLLSRIYALDIPVSLNPDEAQWTVSARRILDDPIVWRSNDLQTSGPLNALVISWPYLFGLVPSIFTSRLTGLLLQSGALLGIASSDPTLGLDRAWNGCRGFDSHIPGFNDRGGLSALQ